MVVGSKFDSIFFEIRIHVRCEELNLFLGVHTSLSKR